MKVALLAPIEGSLYSRSVAHLIGRERDLRLVAAIVRTPWTWRRIRSEWRRDGVRLLRKAYRKLVLRHEGFDPADAAFMPAFARRIGLPGRSLRELCCAHDAAHLTVPDHHAPTALKLLERLRPDVIVFTGGGLLREPLLSLARHGVLNCHLGLLPRYRGMDVVEYPLLEASAEPATGLTVHAMDRGVDTGPILLHRPVPTEPDETFERLRARMLPFMAELILDAVRGLRDGILVPQPQAIANGRQYFVMHPRLGAAAETKLKRLHQSQATGVSGRTA